MSVTTIVLIALVAAYFTWYAFRICKLIWTEGAKGEVVDAEDAAMVFLRDIWKVIKLPYVAWKAFRKS